MARNGGSRNGEKKRWCACWQIIILLVAIGATAGVLIWLFAWDAITGNDSSDPAVSQPTSPNGSPPSPPGATPAPTPVEAGGVQFFQCGDNLDECCNGLDTICDLRVNEIMYATAHNAMSTEEDGFPQFLFPNHEFQLEKALEAGYRGVSIDVCNCGNTLQLCHGVCNIGARDPMEVFNNTVEFLVANPTETVIFNIEINDNVGDVVSLDKLYALMKSVNKFTDMVYVHDGGEWPTLRTLVQTNKRILLFHFNGENTCDNDSCPEGLHYWFNYAAETDFDFNDKQELENFASSCRATRGRGRTDFFAVNHFTTPPLENDAKQVNTQEFIEERISECSGMNSGKIPNLFFVDYWSVGDLLKVTQSVNENLGQRRKRRLR